MNRKLFYFFFICIFIFLAQFFIFSSKMKNNDELFKSQFQDNYNIYSIVKPKKLDFAGEKVPIFSSEIWERLDKEMLKNIYWQSNTLLYIKRANKYFPTIEKILKDNNVPDDFKYLALIESGLENVVSPSGAAGFWQFLKTTAKEYGLEVNSYVDERYNLEKSTEAACKYLLESYQQFGSWTMAAASYNMGRSRTKKIIKLQDSNNYYNLHLNSETSRYVFRIIAIKEILQNPDEYGFNFRSNDLYEFESYKIIDIDTTITDLYFFAKIHEINYKMLKLYNPWLRKGSLPDESRKMYHIKIPFNKSNELIFPNIEKDTIF